MPKKEWPSVLKLTCVARNDMIVVTVKTKMFCGHWIQADDHVSKHKEYSTKDRLHDKVDNQARGHIKRCAKCRGHYS